MSTAETDEFDAPLGGLPSSGRQVLGETHIEAAVAEVRFVASRTELPEAEAAEVWRALGSEAYPIFEKSALNTWNITVTPDGAGSTSARQDGWVVASASRDLTITLLPSMVIVQNSKYERFSTGLAEPLRRALEPFVMTTGAQVINRIGLRYINRLSDADATSPRYWADRVQAEFAGPICAESSHRWSRACINSCNCDSTRRQQLASRAESSEGPEPRDDSATLWTSTSTENRRSLFRSTTA